MAADFRSRLRLAFLWLVGIVVFLAVGILLEQHVGIPLDTSYRIACIAVCLHFIGKLAADYPGERWPWTALGIAAAVNVAMLFTPLFDRPASRGEIMLFALPDTVIFLTARCWTYPVPDIQARAVRQQLIVGLVLATMFCALILSLTLIPDPKGR